MDIKKRKPVICIVDDDEFSCAFATSSLESTGDVYTYKTAEALIEQIKSTNTLPDLLVIDIVLTRMNGIDLVRWIKHEFPNIHVPIVMLSSHTDTEMQRIAFESGATAVISKGLSEQMLRLQVIALLKLTGKI